MCYLNKLLLTLDHLGSPGHWGSKQVRMKPGGATMWIWLPPLMLRAKVNLRYPPLAATARHGVGTHPFWPPKAGWNLTRPGMKSQSVMGCDGSAWAGQFVFVQKMQCVINCKWPSSTNQIGWYFPKLYTPVVVMHYLLDIALVLFFLARPGLVGGVGHWDVTTVIFLIMNFWTLDHHEIFCWLGWVCVRSGLVSWLLGW